MTAYHITQRNSAAGPNLEAVSFWLTQNGCNITTVHESTLVWKGEILLSKQFITAEEVGEIMGYSVRGGYDVIKRLNDELKAQGYIIRAGRVPRKYFFERVGLDQEEVGT